MKKLILSIAIVLFSGVCFADGFIVPPVVIEQPQPEQIVVPQPPKVLQKKIKWVLTPNVIFQEIPVYRQGMFGGIVVRKEFVLTTVWQYTPVEVWE